MARREPEPLSPRISPTFPTDMRELIHLASQIVDDRHRVRSRRRDLPGRGHRRPVTPQNAPNLEEMYAALAAITHDLLARVTALEERVSQLTGDRPG